MDLAAALIQAIEDNRDQLNAEAAPFVGRVPFHVDLDANVLMLHIVVTLEPCPAPEH